MRLKIIYGFCCYLMTVSIILFTVISGVGYHYFSSSLLQFSFSIDIPIMFGCGIGVGLLLLIALFLYFTYPTLIIHYVLTFPTFFCVSILYIIYCSPKKAKSYVGAWDSQWQDSITIRHLQITQNCCGWNNESDRGLLYCPLLFTSGCKNVINGYLQPRFHEIYVSSFVMLSFNVFSLIVLSIGLIINHDLSIFELLG